MMYHNPQAQVQVSGKRSVAFVIVRSVRQSCSQSPLLYILALEPLLRRLRDEKASPVLRGVPLAGCLSAKVSKFADDITVFVPPSGHKGGEEGGCEVRIDSRGQDQL